MAQYHLIIVVFFCFLPSSLFANSTQSNIKNTTPTQKEVFQLKQSVSKINKQLHLLEHSIKETLLDNSFKKLNFLLTVVTLALAVASFVLAFMLYFFHTIHGDNKLLKKKLANKISALDQQQKKFAKHIASSPFRSSYPIETFGHGLKKAKTMGDLKKVITSMRIYSPAFNSLAKYIELSDNRNEKENENAEIAATTLKGYWDIFPSFIKDELENHPVLPDRIKKIFWAS